MSDTIGTTTPAAAAAAGTATDARLLRLSLRLDAVATAAMGLLFAAGSGLLDDLLGIPTAWLFGLGVFLVLFAGVVQYAATRAWNNRALVTEVIAANALWLVASITTVVAGWFALTTLGVVVVLLQAAAVAGFVALQTAGRRRAATSLA